MQQIKTLFLFTISLLLFSNLSNATTHTIGVGQGGSFFSPGTTNATVGDTIKFQWVSGFHTTTCDGNNGTSLPAGAATWDEMINSSSTSYSYVITVAGTYNYICMFHAGMAGTINATVSSILQLSSTLPEKYNLNQNYPNPFNPSTSIKFDIAKTGLTSLTIYNQLGQQVDELLSEELSPGSYEINWNASALNSGVYFYVLRSGDFVETKKLTLIK